MSITVLLFPKNLQDAPNRSRTYPGSSIPEPLLITIEGDSELKEICKEIMGLTKLDWNTTSFALSSFAMKSNAGGCSGLWAQNTNR